MTLLTLDEKCIESLSEQLFNAQAELIAARQEIERLKSWLTDRRKYYSSEWYKVQSHIVKLQIQAQLGEIVSFLAEIERLKGELHPAVHECDFDPPKFSSEAVDDVRSVLEVFQGGDLRGICTHLLAYLEQLKAE